MKKLIIFVLMLALCLAAFAGCDSSAQGDEPVASGLDKAKEYLYTMYKDSPVTTPADYKVVGAVIINGVSYNVEWTADSETVKFVKGDDNFVTVDVDEKNPEELLYKLTATLSDAEGKTAAVSFEHKVPAAIIIEEGISYAEIVDLAYKLEDGLAMDGTFRLFGTITKIDTPWSPDYKNITVTIAVPGNESKPIMCYRLKGEGADTLAVGDPITVEGVLKNYKGTIEFDAGCVLVGFGDHMDPTAILEAAYKLEDGLAMTEPATLTGIITKIDTPWSPDYKNITVTIVCGGIEDKPMMCYRLKGEGADKLAVGDTITVTGTIKNYKGTIEFDAGCTLDYVRSAGAAEEVPVVTAPENPVEIVTAAYALKDGEVLPYTATLTGKITEIGTPWNDQYGNITVTITVDGADDKPIVCFRLKGDGAKDLAVGNTITVTGSIKNYQGTIEFDAGCKLDAVK